MKAAAFTDPGAPLRIDDVADPTWGPDDLIIEVRAGFADRICREGSSNILTIVRRSEGGLTWR
ncbi:MAG: hypothetical protein AAF493_15835 [Pseudomonadota bacterium]